jgi:hypothetical protein
MCVGMLGGLLASCASSILLRLGCATCSSVGGVVSQATRISYAMLLVLATIVALAMLADWVRQELLSAFQSSWFSGHPDLIKTDPTDNAAVAKAKDMVNHGHAVASNATEARVEEELLKRMSSAHIERLVGALAVYRIMTGVCIFHAALALATFGVESSKDPRAKIQNAGWGIKCLLYVLLIGVMFFVPTAALPQNFLLLGACLFLLLQVAMLVASSYDIYDSLATMSDSQQGWLYLTLAITLASYIFSIVVFGAVVSKHGDTESGCSEGLWAVSINMLLMVVTSGLSLSSLVRDATNGPGQLNGVFQSGLVSAYANYQVMSALTNHPGGDEAWRHMHPDELVRRPACPPPPPPLGSCIVVAAAAAAAAIDAVVVLAPALAMTCARARAGALPRVRA